MKTFCKFFVCLIVLSCTLNTAAAQEEIVDVPDPILAAVIRDKLGLAPNAPITRQQMYRLGFLTVYDSDIIRITGERNWIRNLTGLEHATELRWLILHTTNWASDLSPLTGLTQLTNLELSFGKINDLSPLTGLTQLTNLELIGNKINDLRPIAGLTQLKSLRIPFNPISDFSPLTGLTQLTELAVSVTSVEIMSDLRRNVDLTQLQHLTIYGEGNQIGDINFFENLTELEYLTLFDAQISDVSPLAGLTNLQYLGLGRNQISDVSPLVGLINLRDLHLSNNQIVDVTPLAGLTNLRILGLRDNQIIDITPLAPLTNRLTNRTTLWLEGNPIVEYTDFLVVESVQAHHIKSNKEIQLYGPGPGVVIHDRYPGQDFEIHATVRNRGIRDSTAAVLKYYLSNDKDISTDTKDDKLLDASLIKPLPVGNSAKVSVRVTAPKTPGVYYYGACLADSVGEGNCLLVKITVRGTKPDLVVGLVESENMNIEGIEGNIYAQLQRSLKDEQLQFELHVKITNQGSAASPKTILQYYESANNTLSESDTKIGSLDVPALKAGKSFEKSVTVKLNRNIPFGPTYYGVYVKSVQNESKTENNWSEPAQLFIFGDTIVKIPEGLISQVAFGSGYTYFVLRSHFPKLITGSKYSIGDCIIGLDLPGVPSKPVSKDSKDYAMALRNPGYFMYPLETPHHRLGVAEEAERAKRRKKIKVTAQTAGAIGFAAFAVASAPAVATASTLYTLKAHLAVAKGSVSLVYLIHSTTGGDDITKEEEILTATADPVVVFRPFQPKENVNLWDAVLEALPDSLYDTSYVSDSAIDVLFLVNTEEMRQDRDLRITISQTYQYDFDEENKHRAAEWTGIWNLEERWQQENPGLAAPRALLMSLADYPPFQRLPLEVQEYLLQHFGETANAKTTNVDQLQIPEETSLLANYPNPFNPETWIPYQLAAPADVSVAIYAADGKLVRTLDLGHQPVGIYQGKSRAAHWDGKNALGESVASGVYFYTLKAGDFSATRKMLIRK